MDRKKFLRNSLLGLGALAAGSGLKGEKEQKTGKKDRAGEQVGYNHIPKSKHRQMKKVIHKAETRGHANHGWLNTRHSFSFANYYNPERMNFGVLRVLNDDIIRGGTGFPTHPHNNMEIISVPLKGGLRHKDSMGNEHVIREHDVQVMSAGSGIQHSEYNDEKDKESNFLQIWVFPDKKNVEPRYDQITFDPEKQKNKLQQVLSPNPDDEGVWIHQKAWFHRGFFEAGKKESYKLRKSGNGVYVFVIEGEIEIDGEKLGRRDAVGVWETPEFEISMQKDSDILLMEVPMNVG